MELEYFLLTWDDFRKVFFDLFLADLSKERLQKYRFDISESYLWGSCEDTFSAYDGENIGKLRPAFEGNEARRRFDLVSKDDAVCILPEAEKWSDGVGPLSWPLPKDLWSAAAIGASYRLREFYVLAGDGSWCYIVTYEEGYIGPFFVERNSCSPGEIINSDHVCSFCAKSIRRLVFPAFKGWWRFLRKDGDSFIIWARKKNARVEMVISQNGDLSASVNGKNFSESLQLPKGCQRICDAVVTSDLPPVMKARKMALMITEFLVNP